MKTASILLLLFSQALPSACQTIEFGGQLSGIASYTPDNSLDFFLGARYIPEFEYNIHLESGASLDFMASANVGASSFLGKDGDISQSDIDPYRIWARYTSDQLELRLGLQKINFGSSVLLRPIQWFNQIDPRDPLQITDGVYGALGRYYFLNNANVWLWLLYGNEQQRGFDFLESVDDRPEIGGRIQHPFGTGEFAISYHNRATDISFLPDFDIGDKAVENKIGIDGKFDAKIGIWFEATHSFSSEDLGMLKNQTLLSLGSDYTFNFGSGLNLGIEHLVTTSDEEAFAYQNVSNFTALSGRYALSFFDGLSGVLYYSWDTEKLSIFANYEHQFDRFAGFLMAFYNPRSDAGLRQGDFIQSFAGPGLRVMFVFNH